MKRVIETYDEITGEWYCIYCEHWYDNGEKCNCEERLNEREEEFRYV
jgi:hypothetical protein